MGSPGTPFFGGPGPPFFGVRTPFFGVRPGPPFSTGSFPPQGYPASVKKSEIPDGNLPEKMPLLTFYKKVDFLDSGGPGPPFLRVQGTPFFGVGRPLFFGVYEP